MVENEMQEIAICPLCYCPYDPTVEDCPECKVLAGGPELLPDAGYVNETERGGLLRRLQESISNLSLKSRRSNKTKRF